MKYWFAVITMMIVCGGIFSPGISAQETEYVIEGDFKIFSVNGADGYSYAWTLVKPDSTIIELSSVTQQSEEILFEDLGLYTILVQATDINGCLSEPIQKLIQVLPANKAPVAERDSFSTLEDVILLENVFSNDFEPDGDSLIYSSLPIISTSFGQLTINIDGTFSYAPDSGFYGEDQFIYEVCDNGDPVLCDQDTVVIEVIHVNHAPMAKPDSVSTLEDIPLIADVSINDFDRDTADVMMYNTIPLVLPVHGALNLNDDGTFNYMPDSSYFGYDRFVYEVCDNGDPVLCDQDTVIIEIIHVNHAPISFRDSITTLEDNPVYSDVSINDYDRDPMDTLVYNIIPVMPPANGFLEMNADGTYIYTPDSGFYGQDQFVYEVCDNGDPVLCDQDTVVIEVVHVNHAPVAVLDSVSTLEDTALTAYVSFNDFDRDTADALFYNVTPLVGPAYGILNLNANGSFTYTPDSNFFGYDRFVYEVCDNGDPVLCDQDTVIIEVVHVNHAPITVSDSLTILEDNPVYSDVSINDYDGDPMDTLTYNVAPLLPPANGLLEMNADGTFTYTPHNGFYGQDRFVYEVCDNGDPVLCNQDTVVIEVIHVNHAPVAISDSASTLEDIPVTINVSMNDSDRDTADVMVYNATPIVAPGNGLLELSTNGTYIYTPNTSFYGVDYFVYEVCDNGSPVLCDQDTVVIEVIHVNHAPVAVLDSLSTFEDNPLTSSIGVNDFDPDTADVLTYNTTPLLSTVNGTLEINPDGTFTYTPEINFYGEDRFVYEVCDNGDPALCDQDTVIIEVVHVNHSPFAIDDYFTTLEDELVSASVLANDSEPDGDSLYVSASNVMIENSSSSSQSGNTGLSFATNNASTSSPPYTVTPVSLPTKGELILNADGTFIYTPDSGAVGFDQFEYVACDDGSPIMCDQATVIIEIIDVNHAPVAEGDDLSTFEDIDLASDLSNNDMDPDGDSLFYNSVPVLMPVNGDLILNSDGTFVYSPDSSFYGEDRFIYEVCDNGDPVLCDVDTVIIEVVHVNHAPVTVKDNLTTTEDVSIYSDLSINDFDRDHMDTLSYNAIPVEAPLNGTVSIHSNGTFTYIPNTGFYGKDYFIYEVCDNGSPVLCSQDTVSIEIIHVNHAPVAVHDSISTLEDIPISANLSVNDFDVDTADVLVYNTTPIVLPANGLLEIKLNGEFNFIPDSGYFGTDYFVYEVCDNGNPVLCDQDTVFIEIIHVNHAPIVQGETYETEGEMILGDLSLNDSDPDEDSLVYNSIPVWGPASGELVINSDGTFIYTPESNFFGLDHFVYKVCDNGDPVLCGQDTVEIKVIYVNHSPVAVADSFTTKEDIILSENVFSNDSDPDGDDLIYNTIPVESPSHGIVTINPDGTFVYTPDLSFFGTDQFIYEVCDNGDYILCDQDTVTINVIHVNHSPIAVKDSFAIPQDTDLAESVISNDSDPDMDSIFCNTVPVLAPEMGSLELNMDGTFIYTPDSGVVGTDYFVYEICDNGDSVLCAQDTVIIEVFAVNHQPVAISDTFETKGWIISGNVSSNDNDPDGDLLRYNSTLSVNPAHGSITLNTDGTFTYTPEGGYVGEDKFIYEVCDNGSPVMCDQAEVIVQILDSEPPLAVDDEYETIEATPVNGSVLDNDTDLEGAGLIVYAEEKSTLNGFVSIATDGTFTYVPGEGFVGNDQFTYQVCNENILFSCSEATVRILVDAINLEPVAVDDAFTTRVNTPVTASVLMNDTDPEGDNLVVTAEEKLTAHGSVSIHSDGTFVYTPNTEFVGNDQFEYELCDDNLTSACSNATVYIYIVLVNHAPTALNDEYTVEMNTSLNGSVLNNDSDTDGDEFGDATILTQPSRGNLIFNVDGTFIYTPDAEAVYNDKFTYAVCDKSPNSLYGKADVIIHVVDVNYNPIAVNDSYNTLEDIPLSGSVLTNDSDPDNDILTVTNESKNTLNGQVIISSDGTFTYTPSHGFYGTDQFTYEVCDDDNPSLCDQATVRIRVDHVNHPPMVEDDNYSVHEDSTLTGSIIENDFDPDGDDMIVTEESKNTLHGAVSIYLDGSFTYIPEHGFYGEDEFNYQVCDDQSPALCEQGLVTIHVDHVNHPPVVEDLYFSTLEDILVSGTLLDNASDPDGDPLTVLPENKNTSGGSVAINTDGTFTYTPNSLFHGDDQFTYQVCDNQDNPACVQSVVTIHVDHVNHPPVIGKDNFVIYEDSLLCASLVSNDIDVDGDSIIFNSTPINSSVSGSLVLTPSGTMIFTPASTVHEKLWFVYEICDNGSPQYCVQDTVTIEILMRNYEPAAENDTFQVKGPQYGLSLSANDSDPNGDDLTYNSTPIESPTHGHLTIQADGSFDYIPDSGAVGMDRFVYEVCDNGTPSLCDQATVLIDVLPNYIPEAIGDTIQLTETEPVSGNMLMNDFSQGDEALHVMEVNGNTDFNQTVSGSHGTLNWKVDGSFEYISFSINDTLDEGETLIDEFEYVVANESENQDTSTIQLIINGFKNEIYIEPLIYCQNDAAYLAYTVTTNFTITEDSVLSMKWLDSRNVIVALSSDMALSGELLWPGTILDDQGLALDWPGWIYIDDKWITGEDGYENTVPESRVEFSLSGVAAEITVLYPTSVSDCNLAPEMIIEDDYATIEKNTSAIIDVLGNDSGFPYGTTIGIDDNGINNITLNADGTITYIPEEDFVGAKTFTYEVCDNGAPQQCQTGTVHVFVTQGPDRKATNDINTTFANHPVDGNVLLNDEGYLGYNSTVTLYLEPIHGQVDLSTDGFYTYTPAPYFKGIDNFYYVVCTEDLPADCDTVNVTIIVLSDELPITGIIASDDETETSAGKPVSSNVLANDFSPAGESLIVNTVLMESPAYGSATIDNNGLYTYTPDADFIGQDYFIYEVCGEVSGMCATAKVTISVIGTGEEIVFAADDVFFSYGEEVSGNVLINDVFPDLSSLTIRLKPTIGLSNGTAFLNSDGTFIYTPKAGSLGTDYFVYEICDGTYCSVASVFISVIEKPDTYADLSIYKQAPYEAKVGDTILYSLTITNHGNSVAYGIQVSDFLQPELLNPYYAINDDAYSNEWVGLLLLEDSLNTDESMVIRIKGILDAVAKDSLMNYAAVGCDLWDPNLNNNVSVAKTYINHGPNIIILGEPPLALTCCDPGDFHLDASHTVGDDLTYQWYPSIYLDDPTSASPIFTPGESTLYTLVVTDKYGQSDTTEVMVEVLECPDAITDGNVFVDDIADPIMLNGSESKGVGIIYNWWTFDGEILSDSENPTVQARGIGKYYLQVTDSVGCTDVDSVLVGLYIQAINDTVKTVVNVDIDIDVLLNDLPRHSIDASSISIVEPPHYGYASVINDSLIQYSPMMYHAGTDDFVYSICDYYLNCDEARVLVLINDVPYDIPEAFSPNGDGYNDEFEILGLIKYEKVRIDIFDVYGVIVYSSDNYGEGDGRDGFWNGRYNRGNSIGTPVPEGTYYYILNLDGTEKISDSVYLDR